MKFFIIILLAAVVFGGFKLKNRASVPSAPAVSFTDVTGKTRDLRSLERPMVAGFWIENCNYSAKAMSVLKSVRQGSSARELDVVGFYLNAMSSADVASTGAREGYWVTLAACQPPTELIAALHQGFRIRGPGIDIYVVDCTGHYRAVSMVDADGKSRPEGDVKAEVSALVKDALNQG